MRLHSLQMEAFGPFVDRVDVDFDALSDAGLFLLSGATGAGKTSVLDAVCFALYGDVPGERGSAKRLRCDQAAPGTVPRVILEATLSGRRFRLERSPAWERPKKRGTGTTREHASVTVSERVDGAWTPLTSRLDEAGDLINRLVGMSLTQFTQVALLPQGRFQAFLRASSEERHKLLQQLFRTGRFERVERWLREHRSTLARTDEAAHGRVADVVSRISETADVELLDGWDLHDLRPMADDGSVSRWADELAADAGRRTGAGLTTADMARADEGSCRVELEARRALRERRGRLVAAHAELRILEDDATEHRHDVDRLDRARRAVAVLPLQRHAAGAVAGAERAEHAAAAAFAAAVNRRGLPVTHEKALAGEIEAAEEEATTARAALPRRDRLVRLRHEHADLTEQASRHQQRLDEVRAATAVLPGRLDAARATAQAGHEGVAAIRLLDAEIATIGHQVSAHERIATLRPRLQSARLAWLEAKEERLRLAEVLVVLRHERIEGMAAELACALAVGESCPVCGSAEHPHKASTAPGAADSAAEKQARADVDDATLTEVALDDKHRSLDALLTTDLARAGTEPLETRATQLAALQDQHDAASADAAGLTAALAALAAVESERDQATSEAARLAEALVRTEASAVAAEAEAAALAVQLADVITDTGYDDLEEFVAALERALSTCRAASAARSESDRAGTVRDDAVRAVDAAVADAGFEEVDAALEAALAPDDLALLADTVTAHQRRLAAVTALLRDLDPRDLEGPDPDVEAAADAHARADEVARAAQSDAEVWRRRSERLSGLVETLAEALATWAPVRRDLGVATSLATFVEGKSADNRHRMRLSAYVLAYRLSQVVAAANERLTRMSDQRFSLEHTGQRGVGETRGGLSLLVRDDWSGETRDPATLSGGETFVVSLALALGLADVIAHEAGGAQVDTLFVDEGFGSLDADTLDDVMDILDSLRDGGRVVGVVSHVAEMQTRIPTQLVVTKSRSGSTVRLQR